MKISKRELKARAVVTFEALKAIYPPVTTFLTHDSPFQLLIAVILSAQCTDDRVNIVTPGLFAEFPDAGSLSQGSLEAVQTLIKSVNYYKTKAKNIIHTAHIIVQQHQGEVPQNLDALVALPGVGRKTANVVLGQAFGIPGITVDTHVKRLCQRLGFTKQQDAVRAERDLMAIWPDEIWIDFSSYLILHGRNQCMARQPVCEGCVLTSFCPKINVK